MTRNIQGPLVLEQLRLLDVKGTFQLKLHPPRSTLTSRRPTESRIPHRTRTHAHRDIERMFVEADP
jgi:hypothetical protein